MKKSTILFALIYSILSMAFVVSAESIGRGDLGEQVLRVQRLLINQGYLIDTADGIFGNNTEYAVKSFQKSKGLASTGSVDERTLTELEENNKKFISSQASRNVRSAVQVARFGDRGRAVRDVQQRLVSSGFSPGNVDGVFGNDTARALKRFQAHYGLNQTGELDADTMQYLSKERGVPDTYKQVMVMRASAYTSEDPGNGAYTARGNLLRRGLVSVDPSVIPLGTELYIEGYGYAVADDTGGAIRGDRIDLGMESRSEALEFGRREVKVYIL